jgi:Peptidase MA superfamily
MRQTWKVDNIERAHSAMIHSPSFLLNGDFLQMKPSHLILTFSLLFVTLAFTGPQSVSASPDARITFDQPSLNFPDSITFRATIDSNQPITSVVIEYGTDQLTCGTVVAKAFPQFTSGTIVNAEWTWEMKQSGSLPPGATIWWRWRYSDESGQENISEQKSLTWLDSAHAWQTITTGPINLHWYGGDQTFARDLLNAALTGIQRLQNDAGLPPPEKAVDLYIYANTTDMQDAILYEPSWTGGLAFPEYNIVIIGIAPSEIDWGRRTIAHELTHVLVGHLTFSCLGDVPTWLNEGLAVYSEGELEPFSTIQLNDAIRNNELLSVRSLSGGFSEVPSQAYLSYSESYSLVKFLIETYGQDNMNSLLITLRDGTTIDEALMKVYGFDVDGLENAWRKAIRAKSQPASAQATARPTPTFVPTYIPFSGIPLAITQTPFAIPTSSSSTPLPAGTNGPPVTLTIMFTAACCVLLLLLAVLGLGIFLSAEKRKGGEDEPRA